MRDVGQARRMGNQDLHLAQLDERFRARAKTVPLERAGFNLAT